MAANTKKRTLDAFFMPATKKRSPSQLSQGGGVAIPTSKDEEPTIYSTHFTYPFPIQDFPSSLKNAIESLPSRSTDGPQPKPITNQPDIDLLYFTPFIPRSLSQDLFRFLRSSLPFYRVSYTIQRGPRSTNIVTPRFTTVFGLDATSRFSQDGDKFYARPVDAETRTVVRKENEYTAIPPRPMPQCLEMLRNVVEEATGSYHSDDERFLGHNPAIASLSLGARRDFMLKHKPDKDGKAVAGTEVIKMPLGSGDMVLMRGRTQSHWLHAIPKRAGAAREDGGRVNITFRKALVKGGTSNYYTFNVGTGSVYRWDEDRREMRVWEDKSDEEVKHHRGPVALMNEDERAPWMGDPMLKMENRTGPKKVETVGEAKGEALKGEESVYMAEYDDEAWEEKVKREIEGE